MTALKISGMTDCSASSQSHMDAVPASLCLLAEKKDVRLNTELATVRRGRG
jgi:hypothetical protein